LAQIGRTLTIGDLAIAERPVPGKASTALVDPSGAVIGYVVWDPPRPGASILRQVAVPLGLALLLIALVSAISSRYAVRSARRLEHALAAARAADQSKTEFLSTVTHELRTPMNGILGVAQLQHTTDLDDEQRELVGVLFGSTNAQMALISDLLDFSTIEGGNRQLVEEPFEPAQILKDLTDMMRVSADEKGIGLVAHWDAPAEMTVRGDGRAFRQIVTNLHGNAVKFTDRGAVAMAATAVVEADRVRIAVEVADTGRGIPAEALPHVFERFYQAESSMARSTEGTGLGLAISQTLARMMGGAITVTSEPGAGSTFTFTASYPLAEEARDAA
jgi:signal transduction histidine kinase